MAYRKFLQLFRSNTIFATKNVAKATIEINAKHLHDTDSLRDGEPIVVRYYDEGFNYGTFSYTSLGSTNPYSAQYSSKHIWVDEFDSFTDASHMNPSYDGAAYVRIDNSGTYTYYQLEMTNTPGQSENLTIGSIFGVVATHNGELYIEWFDSADAAQGAISDLNYTDYDIDHGFVSAVHQHSGKIAPVHGHLNGANAISVTDNQYSYVRASSVPADVTFNNSNTGTSLPSATVTSPEYFLVSNTPADPSDGYYSLEKTMTVDLTIDSTDKVLTQSANGLLTNISVVKFTTTDYDGTTQLPANVRERYRVKGSGNNYFDVPIDVYKDSSLIDVHLGYTNDQLKPQQQWADPTGTPVYPTDYNVDDTSDDALSFVYQYTDGSINLVSVDIESFIEENEFGDGLTVNNHIVSVVPDDGIVVSSSGVAAKLGDGLEFDSSSTDSEKPIKVKLATDGGLDFKTESDNDSLKIKVDQTNVYYREATTAEVTAGTGLYEYTPTTNPPYTPFSGTPVSGTTYYVQDTYLQTDSNGLSVDAGVLSRTITDQTIENVSNNLRVNGESFVQQANGRYEATVTGSDIDVADTGSMPTVTHVTTNPATTAPSTPGFYEYNGDIYYSNGTTASLYTINASTTLSESTAILSYLAYNMDMGAYTIS